jgi:drug/metabolite transporter (DMT)-like permease
MNNGIENIANQNHGKLAAGVILLTFGTILLIDQFNAFAVPLWILSWPMWLIAWGVYLGAKHNFKRTVWLVMVLLGVAFLLDENIVDADRIVWPAFIMGIGGLIAFRSGKHHEEHQFEKIN